MWREPVMLIATGGNHTSRSVAGPIPVLLGSNLAAAVMGVDQAMIDESATSFISTSAPVPHPRPWDYFRSTSGDRRIKATTGIGNHRNASWHSGVLPHEWQSVGNPLLWEYLA